MFLVTFDEILHFFQFSEKEPDAMQTILEDREGKILSSDDPSTKLSRYKSSIVHHICLGTLAGSDLNLVLYIFLKNDLTNISIVSLQKSYTTYHSQERSSKSTRSIRLVVEEILAGWVRIIFKCLPQYGRLP